MDGIDHLHDYMDDKEDAIDGRPYWYLPIGYVPGTRTQEYLEFGPRSSVEALLLIETGLKPAEICRVGKTVQTWDMFKDLALSQTPLV